MQLAHHCHSQLHAAVQAAEFQHKELYTCCTHHTHTCSAGHHVTHAARTEESTLAVFFCLVCSSSHGLLCSRGQVEVDESTLATFVAVW